MISVWSAQTELPHFDELNSDISTDVLVVGGGLAGVLCARLLTDAGADRVYPSMQALAENLPL